MGARRSLAAVTVGAALLLAGCGGSASDTSPLTSDTLVVDSSAASDPGPSAPADAGMSPSDVVPADTTAELPADFPSELTPPDGTTYRSALVDESSPGKQWVIGASIPGEVPDVAEAIRTQLVDGGFTISSDEEGGIPGGAQSVTVQAESDAYVAGISVDNADIEGGVDGAANVSYTVTSK